MIVAVLPAFSQEKWGRNTMLLDDMKTIEKWAGGDIEHSPERGGALKWNLSPGGKTQFCGIDLRKLNADPTKFDRLKFEYKIVGPCKWFGVKIQHVALVEGKQAVWRVFGPGEGDGKWHAASIDLKNIETIWGDEPVPNVHVLYLRATSADSPCAIWVKDVRFVRQVIGTELRRASGGADAMNFELNLTNMDRTPHEVRLELDCSRMKAFTGELSRRSLSVRPGEGEAATVRFALMGDNKYPPLFREECRLRVMVADEPGLDEELVITPTVPLPKLRRPIVLATPDLIEAAREKVKKAEWAKREYERLIKIADGLLKREVALPERGGQWWHYYACKKCGCRLKTVTPTEHKCTGCGAVYHGDPYDAVVITGQHSRWARNARDLGLAFGLTGKIEYAGKCAEIFKAYAGKYQSYVPHDHRGNVGRGWRVTSTCLGESCWVIPLAQAYDFICDAGVLTPADKQKIDDDFFRPIAESIQGGRSIHNITCWRNAAVGSIGLAIGDQALVEWAVEDRAGLKDQIAKGILADGFWFEGSWGYHFYALSPLCCLAEAASHVGINVFDEQFEKMFTAPIRFMTAEQWLPAFNDSGRGIRVRADWRYGVAALHYPDNALIRWLAGAAAREGEVYGPKALLYFPADLKEAGPPPMKSCVFEGSGIVILRSQGQDQIYVAFEYGPHGGGHGHPDKLGFVMSAFGVELAPDPGSISYAVPLHKQWYRQTLAHNTLVVDQKSQRPTTGELLFFKSTPDLQIASARTTEAYPGVAFERTVAVIAGKCVLVVDRVSSGQEHVYDHVYHNRGSLSAKLDLVKADKPVGTGNGYDVLEDVKRGKAGENVEVEFRIEPGKTLGNKEVVGTRMSVVGAKGSEVITAVGRGNPPTERVPCVIIRHKGRGKVCAMLLEPFRHAPKIKGLVSHPVTGADGGADPDAIGVEIIGEDWRAAGIFAPDAKPRRCRATGLDSDAKVTLLLWENGNLKSAFAAEAGRVKVGGKDIVVQN